MNEQLNAQIIQRAEHKANQIVVSIIAEDHVIARLGFIAVILVGADPFDDSQCRDCLLLPVCSGGCPYLRLMQQANKTDRKEVCPLIKLDMETYLWLHFLSKKQLR